MDHSRSPQSGDPMAESAEGWTEYRKLILAELGRMNLAIHSLDAKMDIFRQEDITKMKVDIAMLKTKAGMFGAAAGAIGGAVVGTIVSRFIR